MIENYFNLKNKSVLITGSTRGIGKALAKGFSDANCNVWVHGRKAQDCQKVAEVLGVNWIDGDLSKQEDIEKIVNHFLVLGKLDILINNAGVEFSDSIETFDTEVLDKTFDINVKAAALLTHKLLPLLKKAKGGNVLNVTSIHQETPYPKRIAYSMSKAALGMMTKCLALELAPYNIRVNNFAPGAVRTEINQEVVDAMEKEFQAWIPLGRVAYVEEMIGTALYLCSDASSYATGSTIYIDGGYREHIVRY